MDVNTETLARHSGRRLGGREGGHRDTCVALALLRREWMTRTALFNSFHLIIIQITSVRVRRASAPPRRLQGLAASMSPSVS